MSKGTSGRMVAGMDRGVLVSLSLTVLAVLASGGLLTLWALGTSKGTELMAVGKQLQVLSQRIVPVARSAGGGNAAGAALLGELRDGFERNLVSLSEGPLAIQSEGKAELSALEQRWQITRGELDAVISGQPAVAVLTQSVQQLRQLIPQLVYQSDEAANLLVNKAAAPRAIYVASRQLLFAQRVEASLNDMLQSDQDSAADAVDRFDRDVEAFSIVIDGLLNGSEQAGVARISDAETRNKIREIAVLQASVTQQVTSVLEASPSLFAVNAALKKIAAESSALLGDAEALDQALAQRRGAAQVFLLGGAIAVALGLIALILAGIRFAREKDRRIKETEQLSERNQRAILRLLDELTNLADGDLTSYATVTEDITGAIADSVNVAIDALRTIVGAINGTAENVSTAANGAQSTAVALAEASNSQAREIASASQAMNGMAQSIDQVSRNATGSAEVAMKSVEIASKGADTVRRSIEGMDRIREQIQQTSKRIKRLGESSQEIGDIIGLIDEIADQTNILALNAAIQASSAGEAGRGFAVVADEVQRLAERAGDATKRVEALVKTIQADTSEAVVSMEQSTSEVVMGARLSEDAGDALGEIESVSKRLAGLIQGISKAAHLQSEQATKISKAMTSIRSITMQTADGTSKTADSIGQLAGLSNQLRESVSGFKLPEEAINEIETTRLVQRLDGHARG